MKLIHNRDAPGIVAFPVLQPPGLWRGIRASQIVEFVNFQLLETVNDGLARHHRLIERGMAGVISYTEVPIGSFMRVLAATAHSYFMASPGSVDFEPLLTPLIRGFDDRLSFLIGGTFDRGGIPNTVEFPPPAGTIHQINATMMTAPNGVDHLVVQIRFFAHLRPVSPVYSVITARRNLARFAAPAAR